MGIGEADAAGALVGDHGFDAVPIGPGDGHTGAAVAGIVPVGVGERRAEEACGNCVARVEGALSARGVAAATGGLVRSHVVYLRQRR